MAAQKRLVGIARSALPSLREAHAGHDRISWTNAAQSRWALGWMTAHLRRGCDAHALVRIYIELLARHDERARASGFGAGQFAPYGLRKRLQIRADGLPVYPVEHFTGNSATFQPTATQLREKRERDEMRAHLAAAKPAKRVRRRSVSAVARDRSEANATLDESKWEKPKWLRRMEANGTLNAAPVYTDAAPVATVYTDAERAAYLAAYNAANASGDWNRARRLLTLAEAAGCKL